MARIENLSDFLSDVATSIKAKTGSTEVLYPKDFDAAISAIEGSGTGGITPVGTIHITENGDYDVTNYAGASVNVEGGGSGGFEPSGTIKLTENGTFDIYDYAMAQVEVPGIVPEGTLEITENGTHDVTNYASAEVTVIPEGELEITTNGQHDVADYATANVNVPVGVFPEGTKTILQNGTFDVTEFAEVAVNVPSAGNLPTSISFAEDSWETIAAINEAGAAAHYYKIGDKKTITTVNSTDTSGYYNKNWTGRDITIMIVGFNHYTLSDNAARRAGMVLMVWEDIPGDDLLIGGGAQYYGWPGATRLRSWLQGTFYNALPTEVRNLIKTVKIESYNGYSKAIVSSNETVFLPSINEVGHKQWMENKEGYAVWLFGDADSREEAFGYHVGYWLRSQGGSNASHHLAVLTSDSQETTITSNDASQSNYIFPIFCI